MLKILAVLDGQLTAQGVVIEGSRSSLLDDVESCQVSARITSIADLIGQYHSLSEDHAWATVAMP